MSNKEFTKNELLDILAQMNDLRNDTNLKKKIRTAAEHLYEVMSWNQDNFYAPKNIPSGETRSSNLPINTLAICRIENEDKKNINNLCLEIPATGWGTQNILSFNYNNKGMSSKYVCYYDGTIVHILSKVSAFGATKDDWKNFENKLSSKNVPFLNCTSQMHYIVEIGTINIDDVTSYCKNLDVRRINYFESFEKFVGKYY